MHLLEGVFVLKNQRRMRLGLRLRRPCPARLQIAKAIFRQLNEAKTPTEYDFAGETIAVIPLSPSATELGITSIVTAIREVLDSQRTAIVEALVAPPAAPLNSL